MFYANRLKPPLLVGASMLALFAGVFAASAGAAEFGALETLASSPVPLTALAVDPTTNLIYGLEYNGTKAYRYDPTTNAWSEIAEAQFNIGNNGGATYLDGKIYMTSTSSGLSMEVFDIATETWSSLPDPLGSLGTADITNDGHDIYLASSTTFVKYDPATETTTSLAAAPAFENNPGEMSWCNGEGFEPWGGLQYDEGKIYGDQGDGCRGFAIYDVAANTWTEEANVPPTGEEDEEGPVEEGPVAGSAFDPVSKSFFIYGDYGGETLYKYDTISKEWTVFTLPFAVDDGGLVYVSEPGRRGIYAIQGQRAPGFIRYTTPEPLSDLSVGAIVSSGSVIAGQQVTYTAEVVNHGPYGTGGVSLATVLPADATLISATASQGSCSGAATVTCALGTLELNGTATVTIVASVAKAGSAAFSSTVWSASPDPQSSNNAVARTVAAAPGPGEAQAPPAQTGPAVQTPAPQICTSSRSVKIHWKAPRGVRLSGGVLTVDGITTERLSRKTRQALISFVGSHEETSVVKVLANGRDGHQYTLTRVFHPCTSPLKGSGPVSLFLKRGAKKKS